MYQIYVLQKDLKMKSCLFVLLTIVPITCSAGGFRVINRQAVCAQPIVHQAAIAHQAAILQPQIINNVIGVPVPIQYQAPISAQGSTVYGYSSVADIQGNVDMALLFNQAARLAEQAQQLAGQASSDFSSLVQMEGQNRAEVAMILAQGQAAREALLAVRPEASQARSELRTFSFQITQQADGTFKIMDKSESLAQSNLTAESILESKCVKCHNQQNNLGGLDMTSNMSQDDYDSIINRIKTDDLGLRMPRNSDGTAGQKLSDEEIAVLSEALSSK